MAYEIIMDSVQVSPIVGLDVATQQPQPVLSDDGDSITSSKVSTSQKPSGMETVEHMALIVALTLGVLWFFGTTLLKDARI
jgi:hypothetical protein